jgi:hypothetical protein
MPENLLALSNAVQKYGRYPLPSESTQFRLFSGFPADRIKKGGTGDEREKGSG